MADYFVGAKEYFPGIQKIKYEGPKSKNPLAFKYYDPDKVIGGKKMKDHLKFAIAYWHSFCADGGDPFGAGTITHPWAAGSKMETADNKMDAAFEFFTKIGAEYWAFHDRDIAPEGDNPAES